MKKYETMVIVSNTLEEKEAKDFLATHVEKVITDAGGKITFHDFWGARGFAYTIAKQKWGYYCVYQYTLEPDAVATMRRDWNLEPNIVRFMTITVDPKAPEPRPYAELKAEYEAQEKSKAIDEAVDAKPTTKKLEKLTTVSEEKADNAKDTEEKKARAKDMVDKKLDEIISDSSINL